MHADPLSFKCRIIVEEAHYDFYSPLHHLNAMDRDMKVKMCRLDVHRSCMIKRAERTIYR